jgi:hypothetical protein
LTGTTGNDTYVGAITYADNAGAASISASTIQAGDTITGGNGSDTYAITADGTTTNDGVTVAAPTLLSIETVSVRNVADLGTGVLTVVINNSAVTNVVSDRSSEDITFTGIETADVTINGNDTVTNGAVNFSSSAAGSVTNALTINVTNGVNAGVITSTDANDDWTSVTINSTGGTATAAANANVLTSMDVAGGDTLQTLTINATSSLTTGVVTGWETALAGAANKGLITITGAGAVNLGALNAAVEDVIASENSGGVTLTASSQTDFTFVGGAGDERITTGAVLGTGGTVNAGGGTGDRLIVADSTHITEAAGALYTNFEVVQVGNGVTIDMDHVAGITSIRANDVAGSMAINDMSATQAANVTIVAADNDDTDTDGTSADTDDDGTLTLAIKNSTTVGQVDTLALTINDGAVAVGTLTLGSPTLTGIEIVSINAVDNVTITSLTGAASLTSLTLTGAATQSITTGALAITANTSINGSAATGALTINAAAATTNPMAITGGSAADTITTSAQADLVNGGAGIDAITITAGTADVQSDAVASANADLITGFVTTVNDFDYNGALSNGTGAGAGIATTEVASSTTIALALATADAENDIVFIATTDLTGAQETALDACVAGGMTAAEATALEEAMVGTGGALNGAIANLDTVLGASDAVLFQFSVNDATFTFRVTNTDRAGTNTLTASEIELVGVFAATADLVAGDYI